MNQSITVEQLNTSLRVLRSRWSSTQEVWKDVISAYFEKTYMKPLNQQADRTLTKMQELSKALLDAQRSVQ